MGRGKVLFLSTAVKGKYLSEKRGFREKRVLVEDIDENFIDFSLSPELFTQKEYLLSKRDNFL